MTKQKNIERPFFKRQKIQDIVFLDEKKNEIYRLQKNWIGVLETMPTTNENRCEKIAIYRLITEAEIYLKGDKKIEQQKFL